MGHPRITISLMRALVFLAALAACDSPVQSAPSKPAPPEPTTSTKPEPRKSGAQPMDDKQATPTVTARARQRANTLALEVTFTNRLSEPVYAYEKNVAMKRGGIHRRVERPTVERATTPSVADVILGRSSPDAIEVRSVPKPSYRVVEPGKTVTYSYQLAWPLTSFHPQGETLPIHNIEKLNVSVEYLTGKPAWRELATEKGEPAIQSPQTHTPVLNVATTIPIEKE
jgi:hypothetical protein